MYSAFHLAPEGLSICNRSVRLGNLGCLSQGRSGHPFVIAAARGSPSCAFRRSITQACRPWDGCLPLAPYSLLRTVSGALTVRSVSRSWVIYALLGMSAICSIAPPLMSSHLCDGARNRSRSNPHGGLVRVAECACDCPGTGRWNMLVCARASGAAAEASERRGIPPPCRKPMVNSAFVRSHRSAH